MADWRFISGDPAHEGAGRLDQAVLCRPRRCRVKGGGNVDRPTPLTGLFRPLDGGSLGIDGCIDLDQKRLWEPGGSGSFKSETRFGIPLSSPIQSMSYSALHESVHGKYYVPPLLYVAGTRRCPRQYVRCNGQARTLSTGAICCCSKIHNISYPSRRLLCQSLRQMFLPSPL
jgi:hypothetical protein